MNADNRPPEEDVEGEVTHLLAGLMYSVAARHVAEENTHVIRSLEKMQQRIWAREDDEWRQTQQSSRCGHNTGRRQQQRRDNAHAGQTSNGASTSRRRAAAADSDAKSLMSEYPRVFSDQSQGSSSCSSSAITARGAAAATVSGARSSSSHRPWALVQAAACAPSFASYAESLLPATPPRSQFVFEVEKPINVHAPVDKQKQSIQRRLSMLNALQQETVKLERKARLDARSAANIPSCFYKPLPTHLESDVPPHRR